MFKGLEATGGASVGWLVGADPRWIMNARTNRPKSVLVSKTKQVPQFVSSDLGRQLDKVDSGSRWLRSSYLNLGDGCLYIPLKWICVFNILLVFILSFHTRYYTAQ